MSAPLLKTDAEIGLEKLFTNQDSRAYQQAAFDAYRAKGLPSRRVEEYKYSDLRLAFNEIYDLATSDYDVEKAKALLKNIAPNFKKIVLVNGELDTELSDNLPDGAMFFPQMQPNDINGLGAEDPVVKLNEAFTQTSFSFTLSPNMVLNEPVALIHLGTEEKTSVYSRVSIYMAENASLNLYEIDAYRDNTQSNHVLHIMAMENAKFTHYRHQTENASNALWTAYIEADTNTEVKSFALNEGVAFARNQYFVELMGHDTKLDLNGIQLLNGEKHGDTTLQVRHHGLRGESRELFKNVLKNGSRGVFQGKIIVNKDAQKTDGKMSSNAILLDDNCEMMNKPELEIYADDVLCGHGATCGQIDDDLLFYMMARGIAKQDAFALLLQAFCGDALEKIDDESLKELFTTRVATKLQAL